MTFITANDVAALIGFADGSAFLTARDRLEKDHDFPVPMPTCLRPLKWRREAVEAWLNLNGRPISAHVPVSGHNVVLLDEARRV